jgi:hypothetical protein
MREDPIGHDALKECVYLQASVKASPEAFPTLNTFILIHLRSRSMQKV